MSAVIPEGGEGGDEKIDLGAALAVLGGAVLGLAIEPRYLDAAARLLRREVAAMAAGADRYGPPAEVAPRFDPSWVRT